MNNPFVITAEDEPVAVATSQTSAINAMLEQAAKHLILYPNEVDYDVEVNEDADSNVRLTLKVSEYDEVKVWTGKLMPVHKNCYSDPQLTAKDAIDQHIKFLES
jgi:hypothetical protein